MRWGTVSGPLLCLSSALALLHAVDNAQVLGCQASPKSGSIAEPETAAGAAAAAALGLEDLSQGTIMDPLGLVPVYSNHDNQPIEQRIQSGSIRSSNSNNDNGDKDESINSGIKSSNTQTPQTLSTDLQGGTRADETIAKLQKWLNSPKSPRKLTRKPSNSGQVPNSGTGDEVVTGVGTAPRHDVNRDPCARLSGGGSFGGGPISYDLIKACLDSDFGFPIEVRQDTVDTVKSLITNFYVFEDLAAHPPRGEWAQHLSFQPVELIKEIDVWFEQSKVPANAVDDQGASEAGGAGSVGTETEKNGQDLKQGEEVEDNDNEDEDDVETLEAQRTWGRVFTKMTDREFHDGISRILLKARDGHLSYDADCFRAFRFQHGFFMSHVVRDGRTVIKVHSVAPYFPFQNGVKEDILNCDVLTIDGRDAVDYIQDWADRHVSMSKDANVRFNAALATPQYRSGLADFFLPGKFSERFTLPAEKSLHFTFQCPTKSNLRLNVKWVGFYTHEQTKPFTNAETYFKSNCIKESFDLFGDEEDEYQVPVRSKFERQEDAEKKDISELKSTLRELLIQGVPPSSAPSDGKPAADPLSPGKDDTNPPLPSSEEVLSKHFDEIVTKLDMISSERLPVVKFYDDYGGRVGELNRAMGTPPFKQLYEGKHGITALMLNDGKTGVITVRTESSTIRGEAYSRVHPAWAGSLLQAIKVLRPHAENLILDLSHNTGGYVCLGLTMVQIFFPERPRLVTNIRLSPLSTQMMTAGAMGMDHFISSYGEMPISALQSGYVVKTTNHPHRNLTFSDFLSDRCAIAETYTLAYDPAEESRRKRARSSYGVTTKNNNNNNDDDDDDDDVQYRPWDPENLAILTDGYCGSSCALISNTMHTKFRVPTVVIGGRTLAKNGPMSYSTFPGLQVVDDALLFTEMHDVRTEMMSSEEAHKLEDGGRRRKFQAAFAAKIRARGQLEEGDDDDDDEDEDQPAGDRQSLDKATMDEAEDEDTDYDTFYPLTFAQKGRLRLTWRQIYNTGPGLELFKLRSYGNGDEVYEPAWNLTEQWHEYSFIPANRRIDYTDHNVHSIGAIWEDTRDALWGSSLTRGGDSNDADEDGDEGSQAKAKSQGRGQGQASNEDPRM